MQTKPKFGTKRDVEEMDAMLPFMSLLLIIIPVLLNNTAFFLFKMVDVSTPGLSEPNSESTPPADVPKTEKMVMAQLLIEKDIVELEIVDEATGEPIQKMRNPNDLKGSSEAYELLKKFKSEYPKLDTVLVTTQVEVPYEKLVMVIDKIKVPIVEEKEVDGQMKKISKSFNIVMLPAAQDKSLEEGK